MRWFFISLITVVTGLFFAVSPAVAATVVKLDLQQLVAHSDVIVVADVVDTEARKGDSGRVYTTITFRTDDVLKGQPGKEFTIRQVGGTDTEADLSTHVPGMPHFEADQQVFLFVSNFEANPAVTGLSQGRFDVTTGDDDRRYVIPRLQGVHLVDPDDSPAPDIDDHLPEDPKDAKQPLQIPDHAALYGQTHKFDAFRNQIEQIIEAQESDQ